jgi:hypothetical protein
MKSRFGKTEGRMLCLLFIVVMAICLYQLICLVIR